MVLNYRKQRFYKIRGKDEISWLTGNLDVEHWYGLNQ